MGNTSRHGFPWPAGTDTPAGHVQMKALADAIDNQVPYLSVTEPAHVSGLIWYNPTTKLLQMSDGATWVRVYDPAWVKIGASGGARIKAGTFNASLSSGIATASVSFTDAFTSTPAVTLDIQPFTNNTPVSWGLTGITTTGFTYYVKAIIGTPGAILAGRYIAVGL